MNGKIPFKGEYMHGLSMGVKFCLALFALGRVIYLLL